MKTKFFVFALMLSFIATSSSIYAQSAELSFTKTEHDYGTIQKNDNGNCEFTFKNTGKEPLILTDVRSSCGCTVPAWTREPVMPGKTGSIKVRYATDRVGAIDKQISVISNAVNSPVVLKIKGNVLPPTNEATKKTN